LVHTHDLALLAHVLVTLDDDLRGLAALDPTATRFRYPGPGGGELSSTEFDSLRERCRRTWDRFQGVPAQLWRHPLVQTANRIAGEAHATQDRKYSGTPYIVHPRRVAQLVAEQAWANEVDVAAALLHDVLEDTPYPEDSLRSQVGDEVLMLIRELTKPTVGEQWKDRPRAEKRSAEWEHLKTISQRAMRIKLADRIDNLGGPMPADFRRKYLPESRTLIGIVGPADEFLSRRLETLIARLESGDANG
jgi:predicted HD phosphohydrolase